MKPSIISFDIDESRYPNPFIEVHIALTQYELFEHVGKRWIATAAVLWRISNIN